MAGPAILLYPPTWVAIGEAAKWTLITLGVAGAGVATGIAVNEMTQDDTDDDTTTTAPADTTTCENCGDNRNCPPCNPPAGTRMFKRLDRSPPSAPHWPCPGDHVHILVQNQNPRTCACFWNRPAPPDDVICIPQGGNAPSDLFGLP